MRHLKRNTRTIAVANRSNVNGVEVYGTPISHKVNFRFSRGAAAMEGLGESVDGTIIANVDPSVAADFNEFDKVYVFAAQPAVSDVDATDADYVVEAVMPGLNAVEVRLKRVNT